MSSGGEYPVEDCSDRYDINDGQDHITVEVSAGIYFLSVADRCISGELEPASHIGPVQVTVYFLSIIDTRQFSVDL